MPEATQDLEVYLVGGAVRDELLGETVKDRDWVVVGSTPEAMLALGFKAVGREFPVFLHPQTKEEYALARTEKKVAPGYTGFVFNTAPEVTLEQDLRRRDLTINAMARDSSGRLVDPFSGKRDLERGILRHVSDAFVEDPVRVLRVARFRARFGFEVARETLDLMRQLSHSGEVDALVAERVWAELVDALSETRPSLFFETLRDCEALQRIFPEIHALFGVPQRKEYHPEIDTGVHTMLALDAVSTLSSDLTVRCAVLLHDLGKARTPREQWPRHHGHEALGVPLVRAFCERLRAPRSYRDLALLVCRYHLRMHKLSELKAATILDLLERLDGFRKPERITQFALACEADSRGRAGLEDVPYPQAAWLANCFAAAAAVDGAALAAGRDDSTAIAAEIRRARCAAIQMVQDQFANT